MELSGSWLEEYKNLKPRDQKWEQTERNEIKERLEELVDQKVINKNALKMTVQFEDKGRTYVFLFNGKELKRFPMKADGSSKYPSVIGGFNARNDLDDKYGKKPFLNLLIKKFPPPTDIITYRIVTKGYDENYTGSGQYHNDLVFTAASQYLAMEFDQKNEKSYLLKFKIDTNNFFDVNEGYNDKRLPPSLKTRDLPRMAENSDEFVQWLRANNYKGYKRLDTEADEGNNYEYVILREFAKPFEIKTIREHLEELRLFNRIYETCLFETIYENRL